MLVSGNVSTMAEISEITVFAGEYLGSCELSRTFVLLVHSANLECWFFSELFASEIFRGRRAIVFDFAGHYQKRQGRPFRFRWPRFGLLATTVLHRRKV